MKEMKEGRRKDRDGMSKMEMKERKTEFRDSILYFVIMITEQ